MAHAKRNDTVSLRCLRRIRSVRNNHETHFYLHTISVAAQFKRCISVSVGAHSPASYRPCFHSIFGLFFPVDLISARGLNSRQLMFYFFPDDERGASAQLGEAVDAFIHCMRNATQPQFNCFYFLFVTCSMWKCVRVSIIASQKHRCSTLE